VQGRPLAKAMASNQVTKRRRVVDDAIGSGAADGPGWLHTGDVCLSILAFLTPLTVCLMARTSQAVSRACVDHRLWRSWLLDRALAARVAQAWPQSSLKEQFLVVPSHAFELGSSIIRRELPNMVARVKVVAVIGRRGIVALGLGSWSWASACAAVELNGKAPAAATTGEAAAAAPTGRVWFSDRLDDDEQAQPSHAADRLECMLSWIQQRVDDIHHPRRPPWSIVKAPGSWIELLSPWDGDCVRFAIDQGLLESGQVTVATITAGRVTKATLKKLAPGSPVPPEDPALLSDTAVAHDVTDDDSQHQQQWIRRAVSAGDLYFLSDAVYDLLRACWSTRATVRCCQHCHIPDGDELLPALEGCRPPLSLVVRLNQIPKALVELVVARSLPGHPSPMCWELVAALRLGLAGSSSDWKRVLHQAGTEGRDRFLGRFSAWIRHEALHRHQSPSAAGPLVPVLALTAKINPLPAASVGGSSTSSGDADQPHLHYSTIAAALCAVFGHRKGPRSQSRTGLELVLAVRT